MSIDESIATASATEQAAAIRDGRITSRELLDLFAARIERLNGDINAVVTLDLEAARAEADRADAEAARGEWRGPLHGLPITIKDAIEVAGMRSTGGAIELTDHVPATDAPCVARLKAAGAIVFGKTNVPRWSGDLQTFNELFGTTNNPWNHAHIPGGSSGGPAAAVAAGFTAFEVGTDIGGSIRIPSHCCGVFGLKPSYGVVSQRGYLDHVGGGTTDADINVFGPIARSPEDLELLLGILAGPDADDALAWSLELPAPRKSSLSDLRIGTWFEPSDLPIDRDYLALLRQAADALTDAGAKVEEAHPPVDRAAQVHLFDVMIASAVSQSLDDDIADAAAGPHLAWLANDQERARLRAIWAEWFEDYDALLCPVLPVPAFAHNQEGDIFSRTVGVNDEDHPYLLLTSWTGLIGIVELPSAVPPIGRTPAGIPVGVQVVVPYLRDREAVWLAGRIAEVTGAGYEPPPGC
jgi:amidase